MVVLSRGEEKRPLLGGGLVLFQTPVLTVTLVAEDWECAILAHSGALQRSPCLAKQLAGPSGTICLTLPAKCSAAAAGQILRRLYDEASWTPDRWSRCGKSVMQGALKLAETLELEELAVEVLEALQLPEVPVLEAPAPSVDAAFQTASPDPDDGEYPCSEGPDCSPGGHLQFLDKETLAA